ncbi:hypothetical protein, partial [Klebsiella pneumoniae]|uniref:hypothetical protein n=1 Tax=Klebsiella pneumoniae TaxID=573 RepID=UPI00396A3617
VQSLDIIPQTIRVVEDLTALLRLGGLLCLLLLLLNRILGDFSGFGLRLLRQSLGLELLLGDTLVHQRD